MSTPIGTTVPYATVNDLMGVRDWRNLADWISVLDSPTPGAGRGTQAQFIANGQGPGPAQSPYGVNTYESLLEASGEAEATLLRGGKYTVDDLQTLQASGNSSWRFFVRFVCCICVGYLSKFKSRNSDKTPQEEWADAVAKELGAGGMMLGFQETADAALPEEVDMYPPQSEYERDRVSFQARRMLGQRGGRGSGSNGGW